MKTSSLHCQSSYYSKYNIICLSARLSAFSTLGLWNSRRSDCTDSDRNCIIPVMIWLITVSRRVLCPVSRDGWLSITESWNSSRAACFLGSLPLYLFLTTPPRTEFWDRAGLVITSRGPGSRSSSNKKEKKRVLLWQPLNNLLYHMTTEKDSSFSFGL